MRTKIFAVSLLFCVIDCRIKTSTKLQNFREMRVDKNAKRLHNGIWYLVSGIWYLASIVNFSKRFQRFIVFSFRTSFLLLLLILACDVRCVSAAYYDGSRSGDSWEDAYLISTKEDLIDLRDRVSVDIEPKGKYYVLTSDIDLTSETDWKGIGFNSVSYSVFSGHFDGQHHTIRINSQSNLLSAGLFCSIGLNNDEIAVRNLNISGTIKANCAGTIVHYLDSGIIENCSFNGTIIPSSTNSSYGAGGIVAHLEGGTVRDCRVNANIEGASYAGGIAGEVLSGDIENCTVEDSTSLTANRVGGIAGIIRSNFSGNISGNSWPSIYPESGNDYTPQPVNPTPQTNTQSEWNGHKYQLFTENLTWAQAKSRCESLGGHLATITTQAEQNFVTSLLTPSQNSSGFWLGAYADDSGWWKWVTAEPFEKQYTHYADGQPDGSGGFMLMLTTSGNLGRWDDVRSDGNTAGFICEWDNTPEEVETAPVAPSFAEWRDNPRLREESDGAAPSPVDRSHLNSNHPRVAGSSVFSSAEESLPAKYDGRTAIGLPEARNQGNYNTCWAFASLGAMEANYRKQKLTSLGEYPDLSELHLAWFVYKDPSMDYTLKDPDECILDQAGDPDIARNFMTTIVAAPVNEADMPYSQASKSDSEIEAFTAGKTFTRSSVILREANPLGEINSDNISSIKDLIRENGAVYFHYYHSDMAYDASNYSYYITDMKDGESHAAILVGWDDDYPAENFKNKPSSNGAWLVRNSHGKNFGDNGYFWMSYEQSNIINMDHCYVFIASEDIKDETKEQHLHDEGGETQNISSQWSANIFRADRNENILSVSFNTTDNNAGCQIYINNLGKIKPADPGSVAAEPVLSDDMPYAGHHMLNLPKQIELYEGDYYSVIVKMTTQYEYPSAVEGTVDGYFTARVNEGESYFASGDAVPSVWVDGKNLDGKAYNATIRAVTVARLSNDVRPSITTIALPSGSVGERYEHRLEAQGTGDIEWRAGSLPRGFAFSREGVLSGQSEEAVNEELKFTAFNAAGSAEKTLRLVVEAGGEKEPDADKKSDLPTEDDGVDAGSSGGGCDAGLAGLCGAAVVMLLFRRR